MLKDLTDYFAPSLELTWRERVFVVDPPSKDTGLKLAAINAMGVGAYLASLDKCPTCGRSGAPELPAETIELVESLGNVDIADLSLGEATHAEMVEAGVPGPHIDTMAMYALYYWTLGEHAADQIMAAQSGGGAQGEALAGSSTPPSGPRTASGNRTQRRASSRATGASRRR